METFTRLFQNWLLFVYHCFDRVVISGYLMGLQRPGQVVYWLQQVLGIEAITKEVLAKRTVDYVAWVQAYARNRNIPIEWAEKDVRKEDYVQPYLRRMEKRGEFGVYFIFQTMEQGWTFRPGARLVARKPGGPADYPILHRHRARYRYYYFYLRDEVMGPMILRMGTFIPFEASYYLNGHSYIEGRLRKAGVEFRKDDNSFVSVGNVEALQEGSRHIHAAAYPAAAEPLDDDAGAEIRGARPESGQTGAQLLRASGRVLPEFRVQAESSDSPDLRAQLLAGIMACAWGAHLAILREGTPGPDQGQAADDHGTGGAWPACVSGLLETRVGETV